MKKAISERIFDFLIYASSLYPPSEYQHLWRVGQLAGEVMISTS